MFSSEEFPQPPPLYGVTSYCTLVHLHQFPQVKVAVAQVDFMKERAKGIKFSPTFSFFRNGKKIDEVVGKDPVKLEDHLWLHSDG